MNYEYKNNQHQRKGIRMSAIFKKLENESFSKVITQHFSKKKMLSEIFSDLDPDNEFADAIETVIKESRANYPKDIRL